MMYLLKWFIPYWKRNWKVMSVVIVFGVIASALRAYMPMLIKNIVNGMYTTLNAQYIKENVIAIVVLGFFLFITNLLAMTARSYMNIKIETEIRDLVFKHILQLDQEFYQRFGTGEIITRLIDDCEEKISWFACSGIFRAFQSLLVFIFAVALMIKLNWYLTIWALLPMPILLFIYMKAGNALTTRFNKLQQSISQIYKLLDACFNGIRIIKANSKEASQTKIFYSKAVKQKNREINTVQIQGIYDSLFQYIGFLCTALVFVGGGSLVISGDITLGELVAFQFYSAMLVWPVLDISAFFVRGKRARVSVDRIDELLFTSPSVTMPEKPKSLAPKIQTIEAVDMGYSIGEAKILRDISFSIKTGMRVAFVGKIGSGKSTVAMLISRLADVSEGAIMADGVNIKDYDFNKLRSKIGYVPQQSILFSTTIAENILMGKKASKKDLERAIKIAQLENEMPNFKDGINTVLGDKGATISGGQKQRVAIARALVGRPDILILDDCTSAMDAQTEENLWADLNEFMPGVICLLVTHRTKTISKSDYIITLDKGRISEEGTHLKLMRQDGLYKQIYQEQRLKEEYRKLADKL